MVHNQIQGLSLSTASYYRTWSICWFPKAPYIWLSDPTKEIVSGSGKHYLLQRHWRSRDKRDIKLISDYICLSLIVVHSLPGSLFYLFEQRPSIKSEHFIRFITLSHFQTLYWTLWPGLLPECSCPPGSGLLQVCQSLTKAPTAWSSIFSEWWLSVWQNIIPSDNDI